MQDFSIVDGFMEVNESLAEMIKYLANEPSVGLFFVQQHAQNAVPNVVNAKDKILEQSRETMLEMEDLEDSITMVKSMKECGFTIIDEMAKDIKKSLRTVAESQPRRGLISRKGLGFALNRSTSLNSATFNQNASGWAQLDKRSGSYFSTVLNSAKQKAAALRWPPLDANMLRNINGEGNISSSSIAIAEVEELPLSSEIADDPTWGNESLPHEGVPVIPEHYEMLISEQEAKLEEWLQSDESSDLQAEVHCNSKSSGK